MSARRELLAALAIVVAVVAVPVVARVRRALAPRPDAVRCAALVDRHFEETLKQRTRDLTAVRLAAAREAARRSPEYAADVGACQSDLTAQQVDCALATGHLDDFERCLQ